MTYDLEHEKVEIKNRLSILKEAEKAIEDCRLKELEIQDLKSII